MRPPRSPARREAEVRWPADASPIPDVEGLSCGALAFGFGQGRIPDLTMKVYIAPALLDVAGALEALPEPSLDG